MGSTVIADGLVARLKARQGSTPNGTFAKQIGLSRQMWEAVLRGDKRLGLYSLYRIGTAYPDMVGGVLDYVMDARNSE